MRLVAHRGESRDAPENTLAAFRLAWARGADAIEFDVRTSRDGAPVVIHDPDTRKFGGPALSVRRTDLATLRTLDAGRWSHGRWRGERIPLLREALATVPRGGCAFVELKEGPASVAAVAEDVAASGLGARRVLLMSFNHSTVVAAARRFPDHPIALLVTARHWLLPGGVRRAIRRARAAGACALNLEVRPALDAGVVREIHRAGLEACGWTVNRVDTARRLAACGLDALATDRAAWLRERLG